MLADELGRGRTSNDLLATCRSAPDWPAPCSSATSARSRRTDIPTGYALVNGRRAVYIPVTKRADASTLERRQRGEGAICRGSRRCVPDDMTVSYELDQSRNVATPLRPALTEEALLGALLTGLMVLLFLRDWRSAAIVVVTIPFALLAAVVALWGAGQTINIMTLGGLALAVGILVDEATVAIENIHTHLARGVPVAGPCSTQAARWWCRGCSRCSPSSRCSCRRSS